MSETFEYDVFLSHNSKDKGARARAGRKVARRRCSGLVRRMGNPRAGDDIYLEIERGLEALRTLVLCMSPAAFGSDWVGLERNTVLFREPANRERRFIPLLLAECQIPDTLRRFKYVDYRDQGEGAFRELVAVCRVEVEAPVSLEPSAVKGPEAQEPIAVLERKLGAGNKWVNSLAVSPDGKWLVSASGTPGDKDHALEIWDLESGECRATLEGHKGMIRSAAITPDGKRILSGSGDNTIRVWDSQTARLWAIWEDHTNGRSFRCG